MQKWPTTTEVREAFTSWADRLRKKTDIVCRVGYFGSLAQGKWGVGSDLDVVVVVSTADRLFFERASQFDTASLPVPVDLLVYTLAEWTRMVEEQRGPARDPVVWHREASR